MNTTTPQDLVSPMMSNTFDPRLAKKSTNDALFSMDDDDTNEKKDEKNEDKIKTELKFRNYQPFSKELKKYQISESNYFENYDWIEKETNPILESSGQLFDSQTLFEQAVIDKTPTWDLKRDAQPQLSVLNQRTQDAIAVLMQEKLLSSVGDENQNK
jgi:coiled-coil domain-containing protein 12